MNQPAPAPPATDLASDLLADEPPAPPTEDLPAHEVPAPDASPWWVRINVPDAQVHRANPTSDPLRSYCRLTLTPGRFRPATDREITKGRKCQLCTDAAKAAYQAEAHRRQPKGPR